MKILSLAVLLCCLCILPVRADKSQEEGFVPLFPKAGVPEGWKVSAWDDVGKPAPPDAAWKVEDGILNGSTPRGTWLVSQKLYGDFILELDFKLGERGNSGVGIRFPDAGDPAFDGLEIQIADERYNQGQDGPDKLTGALYWAIAPKKQVYKPTEWNHYRITCQGPKIQVILNGELIQDVNLDEHTKVLQRHNNMPAPPLKDRPRKGHIGFQELSRGGTHVQIRDARIKVLDQ
jgi:hypothetical protein